jgi:hypothetical protein
VAKGELGVSVVSGVVLSVSLCEELAEEEVPPPILDLNRWLAQRSLGELKDVTEHSGGGKHPQTLIWAGGFNHLDEDELSS